MGNPDFRVSNIRPFDGDLGFGEVGCLDVLFEDHCFPYNSYSLDCFLDRQTFIWVSSSCSSVATNNSRPSNAFLIVAAWLIRGSKAA